MFLHIVPIKTLVNSAEICIYHIYVSHKVSSGKQKRNMSLIKAIWHLSKSFKALIFNKS